MQDQVNHSNSHEIEKCLFCHHDNTEGEESRNMDGSSSANGVAQKHPLLSNAPLYAFSLPQELLQGLALRSPLGGHSAVGPSSTSANGNGSTEPVDENSASNGAVSALGCSLCHVQTFESLPEQRSHFSSDWHRYNVKRKLANKPAVRESEWEGLVEGWPTSIDYTTHYLTDARRWRSIYIQPSVTRSPAQHRPAATNCLARKMTRPRWHAC